MPAVLHLLPVHTFHSLRFLLHFLLCLAGTVFMEFQVLSKIWKTFKAWALEHSIAWHLIFLNLFNHSYGNPN